MANWTAKKLNPRREGNAFVVDIQILKDGTEVERSSVIVPAVPNPEAWVAGRAKSRIGELQAIEGTAIAEGDVTIPADTPPPAPPDAATTAWNTDFQLFTRIWPLVEAGIVDPANPKLVALKKRVKDNMKPEYVGL
jgi:hypothetical protein